MVEQPFQTGYFLLSLDTELAWGNFDRFKPQDFSKDGKRERRSIRVLLDIFREFNIHATWGLVGHLFYDKCEKCEFCPVEDWKGKYPSFNQIYESNSRLWYGPDIIDAIMGEHGLHEIAFHGYTHQVFDEQEMSNDKAKFEIEEWLRLAQRVKLTPLSVIFPRNKVGHLSIFKEYGFKCYRGPELTPEAYARPLIGKVMKRYHRYLSSFIPATGFSLDGRKGIQLLNLPSTQHLFGYNHRTSRCINALNLHTLNIQSVVKGIRKAAAERKVFHLRAHPNDFQRDKDFEIVRSICKVISEEVRKGQLISITMADLAAIALHS